MLRQAQDGYFVSYGMDPRFAPPGPATGWAWGDPHNGGLFSRNADGQIMVGTAAHSSFANAYQEVYSLWQRDSSQPNVWKPQLFTYPDASHYHLKIKEMDQIDWVGAGMDIASIAADALTAGTGGRALNSLQVMATAVGNGLDIAGLAYSGATRMSDGIITASEQWDVVFAIWGTQFPFVFDFASLATNFFLISR